MLENILNKLHTQILLIWLFSTMVITVSAQSKKALVIGISDYESYNQHTAWSNINGRNDATLLTKVLKTQGFQVTALLDNQAVHNNIHQELNKLATSAKKGDIIYFHFSGHGQPVLDLNGDEGADDGWDESIVPIDAEMFYEKGKYEGDKHIIDDELDAYFTKIRQRVSESGMVYAVIDACYSGTAIRGEETEKIEEEDEFFDEDAPVRGVDAGFTYGKFILYEPSVVRNSYYRLKSIPNHADIIVLEACLPHQQNREIKVGENYYGPLSYAIHEVIKEKEVSKETSWIGDVIKLFTTDKRNIRQKIVCESSINNEQGY